MGRRFSIALLATWVVVACSSSDPPRPPNESSSVDAATGRFEIAFHADALTRVVDRTGNVELAFRLRGAPHAPLRGDRYPGAGPDGGDVQVRNVEHGLEDWVEVRSEKTEPVLRYDLRLVKTQGLRSVGGVVELLDGSGTPRLRIGPAQLTTADGTWRSASLDVVDCAADRDPRPPWGRATIAPGGDHCTIEVRWDSAGLRYPILVDPPWVATSGMVQTRGFSFTMTALISGEVLVTGGTKLGGGALAAAELFDPVTRTWASTGSLSSARTGAKAALLNDGKVLIAGGDNGALITAAELYDPGTGSFTAAGSLGQGRNRHTLTTLKNGKVLVAGGYAGNVKLDTCELFDPSTKTFSPTGKLGHPRGNHTATLLDNGKVLVMGGYPDVGTTNDTELYSTGSWASAGDLGAAGTRIDHTATKLADGRVLIVGGAYGVESKKDALLYDPATNAWSNASDMPGPTPLREQHTATLLDDGRVLITGGRYSTSVSGSGSQDNALFYSPSSDTWQKGSAPMLAERRDHGAARLPKGDVLLVGSLSSVGPSAEIFCLSQGCACNVDSECYSGHCVDAVCCDDACAGTCMACTQAKKGQGEDGTCQPVIAGLDTDNECSTEDPSSCGMDGFCDGAGACRLHPQGTVCAPSSCIDDQSQVNPDVCDGKGACTDGGNGACTTGYLCKDGGCKSSCGDASDCVAGFECIGGECRHRPNGTTCSTDDQCDSQHCVDGICCDSVCDGQCEACDVTLGQCVPVTGAPHGVRPSCTGSGECASTCNGADPQKCVYPGTETSCGSAKSCDGAGNCVQPVAICSDDRSASLPAEGGSVSCEPYLCDTSSGACADSCSKTQDCASGYYCDGAKCTSGGSADSGSDGGCSASRRGGSPGAGLFGLLLLALLTARRRKLAAGAVVALTTACSSGGSPSSGDPSLAESPEAVARVARIERQFGALAPPHSVRLRADGVTWVATGDEPRPARVTLPLRADGAVHVVAERSGVAASFRLVGTRSEALAAARGLGVYAAAGPEGADVLQRVSPHGVEDFVVFEQRPARPELSYEIALTRVEGLRLVDDTLELLEADGTPRLRIDPPWVKDGHGERHRAQLALEGCAADRSPVSPFGRPVTPPGSSACTIKVRFDGALPPPLLVDPSWSTTATPGIFSAGASAVLNDGKLLVCGGVLGAKLYSNGAFATTGAPGVSRSSHRATTLPDGRVLVSGGYNLKSAELYSPTTGTWSPAADMAVDRWNHGSILLDDGSVLVTGAGTAQRYLPSSNTWANAGNLGFARDGHTATKLADGRVLVAGGSNGTIAQMQSARVYTLGSGWSNTGSMAETRSLFSAALLDDGKVLVVGGVDYMSNTLSTAELYDPTAGTFSSAGSLVVGGQTYHRKETALVPFGNGAKAYLIGGRDSGASGSSDTFVYSRAGDSWSAGGTLQIARFTHTADLLPNGQILVAGSTSNFQDPAEVQCVDFGCACSGANPCLVGSCVDGVCCQTACGGKCRACSAAKKKGGKDGVCGMIPDGDDPDDECASQPASSCGTIGTCDGAGACRLYAATTECGSATCATETQSVPAPECDGNGTCVTAAAQGCDSGYVCAQGACTKACTTVADCATGFVCTDGKCQKKSNGDACSDGAECASGICADSVCCDSACTGQCQACNEAATPGLCVAVIGDPRGAREPCHGDGVCAGSCKGDPTSCSYPDKSTSCGDGMTCANGQCVQTSAVCVDANAASQPVSGPKTACTPFLCDPETGSCRSSCKVAADCALGFVCDGGQCVNLSGSGGGSSDGGTAPEGGASAPPSDDGGCGCRVARPSAPSPSALLWALAAMTAILRRRRDKE